MAASVQASTVDAACSPERTHQSIWIRDGVQRGALPEPWPNVVYPPWSSGSSSGSGSGSDVFDVCIVGGGITGLTSARLLQQQGMRVAVLEGRAIGSGSTAHSTAKFSTQHNLIYHTLASSQGEQSAQHYANLNIAGIRLVRHLCSELGHASTQPALGMAEQPHLLYTTDPGQVRHLQQEVQAAQAAGIRGVEFYSGNLRDVPSTCALAQLPLSLRADMAAAAVFAQDQLVLNPAVYLHGLAEAVHAASGCGVYEHSRVTDVRTGSEYHTVLVQGADSPAELRAKHVVLGTGLPILDRSGHFGTTEAMRSYCVAVAMPDASDALSCPVMTLNTASAVRSTRALELADGRTALVVAGESHVQGRAPPGGPDPYATLLQFARQHWGAGLQEVTRWAAMDYKPADARPYIGQACRATPRVYTATGFNKWGLSAGSGAALLLRDAIVAAEQREQRSDVQPALAARPSAEADFFDARRWDVKHSLKTIMEAQAHVTKHLVGDKVRHAAHRPSLDTLQPGEGAIVHHPTAGKVCAYKHPVEGRIIACQATCTHLGCDLNWNGAAGAWDCPCHGSVFAPDGTVCSGPAVKNLKQYTDLEW